MERDCLELKRRVIILRNIKTFTELVVCAHMVDKDVSVFCKKSNKEFALLSTVSKCLFYFELQYAEVE